MQDRKFKKGQIADTTTWVVATLIIIVLIVLFVFSSSLLSKIKFVKIKNYEDSTIDWIQVKTSFSLEKNNANSIQINKWIKGNA